MNLLDFARLVRLPNAFTAIADICLGALVTGALPEHSFRFAWLLGASVCLYWAGMVWNDYFDLDQDKRERPFRPLPSGRVSIASAWRIGLVLVVFGLASALLADWQDSGLRWRAFPLAVLLVVAILSYDGWLKQTWFGPIMMGTCRFLNVFMGLSVADQATTSWGVTLAVAVGIYIIGVTWFARTEARISNQYTLVVGAAFMLAGLVVALAIPPLAQITETADTVFLFPYLLTAFGYYIGSAVVRAIRRPLPQRVQVAVKRAVLGLIVLDGILATAIIGVTGLVLLVLLVPAHFLGRWVYST